MNNEEKTVRFYILTAVVLLSICAAAALVLAGLNMLTADRIAENKAAEERKAMLALFADADGFEKLDCESDAVMSAYAVKKGGETVGYVFNTSTAGFSDQIVMAIGMDADGVLTGIKVVSAAETTGFSNEQKRTEYLSKYVGSTGSVHVDAISGATKSSNAAARAVEAAFAAYGTITKGDK